MNRLTNFLANISVNRKVNIIMTIFILGLLIEFLLGINGLRTNKLYSSITNNQTIVSNDATNQLSELIFSIQNNYDVILDPNIPNGYKIIYIEAKNDAIIEVANIIENYEKNILSANNPDISSLAQTNELVNLHDQEYAAFFALGEAYRIYQRTDQQFQELYNSGARYEVSIPQLTSNLERLQRELNLLVETNNKLASAYREESDSDYRSTVNSLTFTLVLTIAASWYFANTVIRSISRRLKYLEQSAESIEGHYSDTRFSLKVEGEDEIAKLGNTFNRLTKQLQSSLLELEDRVKERTTELASSMQISKRRAQQFEAITLVSGAISSIRSLNELLPKITDFISQQFGYYHAGIFLNDANNEYAVLYAANSEGGQHMLERGHQLKIGEQGIVGYVISTGKPRIALDVGEDAVFFDNPDMPYTRSEMALPLHIGESIVGALDVQSTEESAFSEDDINVLSLLADQVSLAIENARLFDQAQKSLAESEALNRQYLRQAWTRFSKEQNLVGFRYNVRGASPIEAKSGMDSTNTSNKQGTQESQDPGLSVPIAIRGETIGTLSVQFPDIKSINEDQMDLVNAVAERVALSAENARLFEETTRRAERERLVSDITMKIRSTNDPDIMIQTALNELRIALNATRVQLVPHTLEQSESKKQTIAHAEANRSEKSKKNSGGSK